MDHREILIYIDILFLIVVLFREWLRPAVAFFVSTLLLLVGDVLTPQQAVAGFSNEQLIIIVLLLILSGIFQKIQLMSRISAFLLRPGDGVQAVQTRILASVGALSAVLNNTPLVAMFLPAVSGWAKSNGTPLSRVLIPLSYISILGGCVTLIGTSTNLIVNGLAVEYGQKPLGMFSFTPVGGAMLLIGFVYMMLFSRKLLPDRKNPEMELYESEREYFIETHVRSGAPLIGRSVEEAGLRSLKGLYLVEIIRKGKAIQPVSPGEVLEDDDILLFAGDPNSLDELTGPHIGLSLPKACRFPKGQQTKVVEVVVGHNSRIVGQKVKDSDFRGRYDGAILAIHRNGERIQGKIGDHELQTGDVLMVLAGSDFYIRVRNNPGFYVLNQSHERKDVPAWMSWTMLLGFLICLGLSFADVSLLTSLSMLIALSFLFNIARPAELRNYIDFNLIAVIVFGLALGKGMLVSGAAERVADVFGYLPVGSSPVFLLFTLFILNNLLAAIMTSKAAVSMTLPVALSVAYANHLDPEPFILCVAFSGAANFITPIGYQTNLMVYGPGGYKFSDFVRIGTPLTIIYAIVSCLILSLTYDFI